MKKRIILGLDIGTSSLKTSVIDANDGSTIQNGRHAYSVEEAASGIVPAKVYEDTVSAVIRAFINEFEILSIGVSTQMYSVIRDTPEGKVVYQWNSLWDRDAEVEPLLSRLTALSGCPTDTLYPAYKLLSVNPDDRRSFLPYGLKEHLLHYLSGALATDYSTASASGLFNIHAKVWNLELIEMLGYTAEAMPEVVRHDQIVGYLKDGLGGNGERIAIVPALGDGVSASYACSSVSAVCGNLGTSMAVRTIVDQLPNRMDLSLWVYAMDERRYVVGGMSPNGCSVLNWVQNLNGEAKADLSASRNVRFFPWLHGEKTPYWASDIKGTLTGVDIETDNRAIRSAIVKSVGFTFAGIVDRMQQSISRDSVLITAGGGMHAPGLMEVITGTIPLPIGVLNEYEYLASHGAAMSAAKAMGIESLEKSIFIDRIVEPTGIFRDEFADWRRMADQLVAIYGD